MIYAILVYAGLGLLIHLAIPWVFWIFILSWLKPSLNFGFTILLLVLIYEYQFVLYFNLIPYIRLWLARI